MAVTDNIAVEVLDVGALAHFLVPSMKNSAMLPILMVSVLTVLMHKPILLAMSL